MQVSCHLWEQVDAQGANTNTAREALPDDDYIENSALAGLGLAFLVFCCLSQVRTPSPEALTMEVQRWISEASGSELNSDARPRYESAT